MNATHDPKTNTLTLTLPCPPLPKSAAELPLSKTGKTRMFCSTAGAAKTTVLVAGQPLTVSLNAYIKA